jgi:hypothetical protein
MRAFLRGIASIFCPRPRKRFMYTPRTDAEALRSDWEAVGRDLRNSIQKVRAEDEDQNRAD